jgi:hypothetical protein
VEVAPSLRYRFGVLAGAAGLLGDTPHYFGGIETAVLTERYGGAAAVQLGAADDLFSFLVSAGAAVRVLRGDRMDLLAYMGPGTYGEVVRSGARRHAGVGVAGISARVPLWRVVVALSFTGWSGRFRGEGFRNSMDVNGTRLGLGLGWGW